MQHFLSPRTWHSQPPTHLHPIQGHLDSYYVNTPLRLMRKDLLDFTSQAERWSKFVIAYKEMTSVYGYMI